MSLPQSYGSREIAEDSGYSTVNDQRRRYLSYEERLASYRVQDAAQWPKYAEISPEELSRSHFIYSGKCDGVICVYCTPNRIISQWQDGEDVKAKHLPTCVTLETHERYSDRYWSYQKYSLEKYNIYAMKFASWGLRYTRTGETTCDYCAFVQKVWKKGDTISHGHTKSCLVPMFYEYVNSTTSPATVDQEQPKNVFDYTVSEISRLSLSNK